MDVPVHTHLRIDVLQLYYFDSDMSNNTNTVVYCDEKDGNLYLRFRTMSHTIYAAKFKQTITHQHVLLRWESQS
jgi:5-formaminoimidazole-4-carboxamide-1-beta-D-ribofuranosyl 5'-monophosphate synthetase